MESSDDEENESSDSSDGNDDNNGGQGPSGGNLDQVADADYASESEPEDHQPNNDDSGNQTASFDFHMDTMDTDDTTDMPPPAFHSTPFPKQTGKSKRRSSSLHLVLDDDSMDHRVSLSSLSYNYKTRSEFHFSIHWS